MESYLFTEFDNIGEKLSLVDTNDVIGSLCDDISQVGELCGRDGRQRLLVVSGDRLAVVAHVVGVLDDEAGVASDLSLSSKFHNNDYYKVNDF